MNLLTIAIVNWNTIKYLEQCLVSIKKCNWKFEYEVIVLDNNSSDGSVHLVKDKFPEITLIDKNENIGFAAGNNEIFNKSDSKYFLVINPDIIFKSKDIEKLINRIDDDSSIAACAVKYLNDDLSFQRFYNRLPNVKYLISTFSFFEKINIFKKYKKEYRMENDDFSKSFFIEQPAASFFLVKRSAIKDIDCLYDEQFPIFFNDVDLCFRLKKAGKKIVYIPDFEVIHSGHKGCANMALPKSKLVFYSSMFKYFRKNESCFSYLVLKLIFGLDFMYGIFKHLHKYLFNQGTFNSFIAEFSWRLKALMSG